VVRVFSRWMRDLIVTAGVGVVVFASTNVDDLFVLLAFFSEPRFRGGQVVAGQYLGIIALTVASLLLSMTALVIPSAYVGLLGLVPLGIGLWKLVRRQSGDNDTATAPRANVLAVAAVTVANGGDNLGVYTPLFATRRPAEIGLLIAVFLLMTALWCAIARGLVRHPAVGAPIRRRGRRLLPWVLIALGAYILVDSGALRW
jgi:cadmium resistance protein CadD (predicted permease)